jgi:hypothetical protein
LTNLCCKEGAPGILAGKPKPDHLLIIVAECRDVWALKNRVSQSLRLDHRFLLAAAGFACL